MDVTVVEESRMDDEDGVELLLLLITAQIVEGQGLVGSFMKFGEVLIERAWSRTEDSDEVV